MSIKTLFNTPVNSYVEKKQLDSNLKTIELKIVKYIALSQIIISLGLLLAAIFNPITLDFISLSVSILKAHSFIILSGIGISSISLLTLDGFFLLHLHYKSHRLSQIRKEKFPRPLEQPLGIRNAGCNCWANATIQFIMNIPAMQQLITKKNFPSLKSIIDRYATESANLGIDISSIDSQSLRTELHSKSSSISSSSTRQEDPTESFNLLTDCVPISDMQVKKQGSFLNMIQPLIDENQSLKLVNSNTFEKNYMENFSFLDLPLVNCRDNPPTGFWGHLFKSLTFPLFPSETSETSETSESTISLIQLIKNFMTTTNTDLDSKASIETTNTSGALQRYPLQKETRRFSHPPENLLLTLKRFESTATETIDKKVSIVTNKIETPVNLPPILFLNKDYMVSDSEEASYQLSSFIIHRGESPSHGHYIACVKKSDTWYLCDDDKVQNISEEEALTLAKSAYVIHYKKL